MTTVTGLDDSYQIQLEPGVYTIAIKNSNYLPTTLEGIVVNEGEVADGSTVMAVAGEVTTVDVVERVEAMAASAESMVAERRLAPIVSDGISGKTFANPRLPGLQFLEAICVLALVRSGRLLSCKTQRLDSFRKLRPAVSRCVPFDVNVLPGVEV